MELLLFGLENIGKSPDVSKFMYTDSHVYLLEKDELYGRHIEHDGEFNRIAPDKTFNALTLDNISANVFSVSDGSCLYFYDYKAKKLAAYTFNVKFSTCAWNTQHDIFAIVTKEGKIKTYAFQDEAEYVGELGENYLSNTNPLNGILPGFDPKMSNHRENSVEMLVNTEQKDCLIDNSNTTISWRNSGTLFAVNFYQPMKQKRIFKIYSKDCKYLVEGQNICGLQSVMSWKPGSTFYLNIPIAQKGKMYIGCFEKTGSLTDSFELYRNYNVVQMEWSNDGEIFAVLQKNEHDTPISLYLYKARKWVMKQYLSFYDAHAAKAYQWLKVQDELFYPIVVLTNANIYKYVFKKGYLTTPNITNTADCKYNVGAHITFASKTLELTAFLENVATIQNGTLTKTFTHCINNVVFHPNEPKFLVIDCNCTFYLCSFSLEGIAVVKKFEWKDYKSLPFRFHHVYWTKNNKLNCICIDSDNRKNDKLYTSDLSADDIVFLPISDICANITDVTSVLSASSSILLEQRYSKVTVRLPRCEDSQTLEFSKNTPVKISGVEIDGKIYVFSLTPSNDLYINATKVLNSVTSFHIMNGYLVFSRVQGMLHCIRIDVPTLHKFTNGQLHLEHSFSVILEVNSIILATIPNSTEVIVLSSMNKYENVKITPLILEKIDVLLENNCWLEAYEIIDEDDELQYDLLVDLSYKRFTSRFTKILESFGGYLNKFNELIENLCEYDVVTVNHRYLNRNDDISPAYNKIESLCELLLLHITNTGNYYKYLVTITTLLLKAYSKSFGIKEAVYYIAKVFKAKPSSILVQDALLYVCSKATIVEVLQEVLTTFNVAFIELTANTLDIRSGALLKLISNVKTMDATSQRLEIRKFVANSLYKECSRLGKELNRLSSSSFDLSTKHITFPENKSNVEINRAKMLESKACLSEACKIYEKYLGHLESTCSMLANKKSFLGAVRVAKKQRNDDLIEREVLPAADKYSKDLYSKITDEKVIFSELTTSLIRIRESLVTQTLDLNTSGDNNTMKEYTDVLNNLFDIVEHAFRIKKDVRQICQVLLSNPKVYYKSCKKLHDVLMDFHMSIVKNLEIIWPASMKSMDLDYSGETCHYLNPPDNISLNWVMPYFTLQS